MVGFANLRRSVVRWFRFSRSLDGVVAILHCGEPSTHGREIGKGNRRLRGVLK